MEEGLVGNLFKQFARKSNLNPLFLYDMTINEAVMYLGEVNEQEKEDLETELQIVRLGVNSALSGKKVDLFKDNKPKMQRIGKDKRKEEIEALAHL